MDCLILGFHEIPLEKVMSGYELMKKHTGAYRHVLHAVAPYEGKLTHYTDIFNKIVTAATGETSDLHLMRMPNLAVAYLKSYLSQRGFDVEIVNYCNHEQDRLEHLLRKKPMSVVITTTYYVTESPVIELIKGIRKISPGSDIILGGPYVNNICFATDDITTQDYIFEKLGADIYIRSNQGEATLADLLTALREGESNTLSRVQNLVYHNRRLERSGIATTDTESPFIRTALSHENNSLDSNRIDWSIFPESYYAPITLMRTARGCPFACSFCNFPTMAGELAYASLDVIENEMKQLHRGGVRYIIFIDDSFNVPLTRYKDILKMMISNNFGFKWVSYFRCSHADDETYDLMKKSGCIGVFLGIESGDQQMLDNMNKRTDISHYKEGIRNLHAKGIFSFISLIVGFPGETEQSVNNTIAFLQETRPTFMKAELYFHAHHVPIHKESAAYGIRGSGYGWKHNTMDWQTACDHLERMYAEVGESLICPVYLFDFWAIPYLLSNGVTLEQIKEFLRLNRHLLLRNFDLPGSVETKDPCKDLYQLGKELAQAIGSEQNTDSEHICSDRGEAK